MSEVQVIGESIKINRFDYIFNFIIIKFFSDCLRKRELQIYRSVYFSLLTSWYSNNILRSPHISVLHFDYSKILYYALSTIVSFLMARKMYAVVSKWNRENIYFNIVRHPDNWKSIQIGIAVNREHRSAFPIDSWYICDDIFPFIDR